MKLKPWEIILLFILCLFVIIVVVLQVIFSSPTTTKLETALFSILQFILSLAFSWILARLSLKNEFIQSQKTFAISAYRRIFEINLAVERLISRTKFHLQDSISQENHELDVITEISYGIRESIRSSISDWAEIIGDEIEKVEKISKLSEQEFEHSEMVLGENSKKDTVDELQKISSQIELLSNSLPPELRYVSKTNAIASFKDKLARAKSSFVEEKVNNGNVKLGGYSLKGYGTDITNYQVGEKFTVRLGDGIGSRGALIVSDSNGLQVGRLSRKFPEISETYWEDYQLLIYIIGKSVFNVELVETMKGPDKKKVYFIVKLI